MENSKTVQINNQAGYSCDKELLYTISKNIIEALDLDEQVHVSLALVDEKISQKLNKKYRKKDYPTDVLSFSEQDEQSGEFVKGPSNYLGEIVICVPVLKKQAEEKGHSEKKELAILFIHGFLHLLGYDHEEDDEAEIMEALERSILNMLGNTYV